MNVLELSVYIPLLVDTIGATLLWLALFNKDIMGFSVIYRLGMAITAIGFLWQINSSIQVLFFGATIGRVFPPLWVLKDIGMVVIIIKVYYDIYAKEKHIHIEQDSIEGG